MKSLINQTALFSLLLMLAACGGGEQPATGDTASSPDEQPSMDEPANQAPASTAGGQATTFEVSLSGSGDEDGSGTATVTLEPDTGQVCYEISVRNIDPPTAAHIHTGAAGETGGVAVPFNAPQGTGAWEDCVSADPATVQQIADNPSGYYLNVHNEPHPAGAVRGQLQGAPAG